jgi:hypothetical protein
VQLLYIYVYLHQLLHTNYIYSFYILLHVSADVLIRHQGVLFYRLTQHCYVTDVWKQLYTFHIIFTVHSVLYNRFYFNQHMHYNFVVVYIYVLYPNILCNNTTGFIGFYNYGCNICIYVYIFYHSTTRCMLRKSIEEDSLMMAENASRNM